MKKWFKQNNKKEVIAESTQSYFESARDWATERYHTQKVMANRWQLAFWVQLAFSVVLVIALMMMLPLKTWEPLIIEHDLQTGEFFTHPAPVENLPKTQQEIESDLVHYVIARETYSPTDEGVRYRQVQFMSAPAVFTPFVEAHRSGSPDSPETLLGDKGLRTVEVEDVIFFDASDPRHYQSKRESKKAALVPPIAKVDFMTTEITGQSVTKKYWVATISFEYLGTPNHKEAAWSNWSGFTVTSYRVDQRNINATN